MEYETEVDRIARGLSEFVSDENNKIIMDQYRASKDIRGMELKYLAVPLLRKRTFAFRVCTIPTPELKLRRPVYVRTRIVEVEEVEIDGKTYLVITCDCGHWFQHLCTCRHVYCLLDREPTSDDIFPEKCKSYETCFDTDLEFQHECLTFHTSVACC